MTDNRLRGRLARPLLILALLFSVVSVHARGTYQTPEAFVKEVFAGEVPSARRVWLSGKLAETYREVLQEQPPQLRLRYWQDGPRSVWILQAIGKEHPITAGFVIEEGQLKHTRVLIFRESRGWEIRYPFFTQQFHNAGLDRQHRLDVSIDAITGATLSVRAMHNMARMALLLDQHVRETHDTP